MSPLAYAGRRLALVVPMLFGMSLLVFGLMRLVPGDPAAIVLGYKATPETIRALRQTFHLDAPLPEQYLRWLGDLVRLDLGVSLRSSVPVREIILQRLPVTAELAVLAVVVAMLMGVPLGIVSALFRNRAIDFTARLFG